MNAPLEPTESPPAGVNTAPWKLDPAWTEFLDHLATPIFVVAPDGTFLFINEACLRLIGSPAREQSLKYNAFRLPSISAAGADVLIRQVLAGECVTEQVDYVSMWGRPIHLDVKGFPIRDPAGQVVAAACALEQHREDQELENRVRQLSLELKRSREMLRSVESLRSRLVAKVSHELRTPLLPLHGYLKLLEEGSLGPLSDKQRKAVSVARRNAQRLIELVEHTLRVSKEGPPRTAIPPRRIEPDVLVQDALDAMAPVLQERDIRVLAHLPGDLPPIRGSRAQLTRVLMTLLDNAQKFTREPGTIEVRATAPQPDAVLIDVSNTGPCIPPEERERVFEPFYQVGGTEHIAAGGAGLGLSIARETVQAHGGEISVLAEPHLDTTIRVRLPAAQPRPESSESGVLRVLLLGGPPERRRRLEILLDEAGHDTRPVPLDERLAERIRMWPLDVVVLWLDATQGDALASIGRIKALPEGMSVPILGIRPDEAPHLDRAALDLGATATLPSSQVESKILSMLELVQKRAARSGED